MQTLASYNDQLGHLIYEEAKQYLIHRLGYPRELGRCSFDPSFAIRGLHFDDRTGYLLKLDQFGKVQLDTVHKGRQKVPVDEIVSRYNGITVSKEYEEQHLHLKADLFCLPEICLLADTIQTFLDSTHDFSPDYVYRDVFRAIEYTHTSGKLHDAITADPVRSRRPRSFSADGVAVVPCSPHRDRCVCCSRTSSSRTPRCASCWRGCGRQARRSKAAVQSSSRTRCTRLAACSPSLPHVLSP